MQISISWQPDRLLLEQLLCHARQQNLPLETILELAVRQYLARATATPEDVAPPAGDRDPASDRIVGMFAEGPTNLSVEVENILYPETPSEPTLKLAR